MKTLLIIANPCKASYSHALADAYKTWAEKRGEEIEILDLHDFKQEMFYFETSSDLRNGTHNGGEKMKQVHEMISRNDEMVFFFPIWWGNMPWILKNFFDVNFSAGFAFKFVKGKLSPEGLLKWKTARVFCHGDAPWIVYKIPVLGIHIKRYIGSAILWACGVKMVQYTGIGFLRKKTDAQKKAFLEKLSA